MGWRRGALVGPLWKQCLDETFGFAVGARLVRPGPAILDGQAGSQRLYDVARMGLGVVGEHTVDTNDLDAEEASARRRKAVVVGPPRWEVLRCRRSVRSRQWRHGHLPSKPVVLKR